MPVYQPVGRLSITFHLTPKYNPQSSACSLPTTDCSLFYPTCPLLLPETPCN
ncbi:hypothetical protein KsCSTR_41850 [Candidatus Kuenenia stuttgartiensis]|uniref:Uncharacterized protein n=1 Tax=Kuenenia stuttgartiensis TaxID=174633 RepID=Q1PXK3_KUEST|nr:hypothetical protein KsCSTR_41850 [Candidatus Kuenenia stuttgartiensis]CAJ71949.1 unknown protein [Candidatus Kuenenia stuttgartiensis]